MIHHQDNLALQKLGRGKPLTSIDLEQPETLMVSAGVGYRAHLDPAVELSTELGASSGQWPDWSAALSPSPPA